MRAACPAWRKWRRWSRSIPCRQSRRVCRRWWVWSWRCRRRRRWRTWFWGSRARWRCGALPDAVPFYPSSWRWSAPRSARSGVALRRRLAAGPSCGAASGRRWWRRTRRPPEAQPLKPLRWVGSAPARAKRRRWRPSARRQQPPTALRWASAGTAFRRTRAGRCIWIRWPGRRKWRRCGKVKWRTRWPQRCSPYRRIPVGTCTDNLIETVKSLFESASVAIFQ